MKILFFSNSIWNIYNFRFPLIQEIAKKNKVIVYCNKRKNFKINKGVKSKNILIKDINFSSKSIKIFDNIKLIYHIYLILKKEKPSHVFTFTLKPNLYCGVLSLFLNFSFFPTLSGLGTAYNKGGLFFFFIKLLIKISFNKINKVFVHNNNEKKILKEIGVKKNKIIQVNGSGINFNQYKKLSLRKNKNNNNFLYTGRLLKDKGLYELIAAFKLFNNKHDVKLTLSIIIDEDNVSSIDYNNFKSKFRGLNIFVKKNFKDIKNLIRSHDCIVLPSYSEGMSRSIMEAASSGRAIICSNINGCKEMVENNYNGFLTEPKSVDSLYRALKRFTNLSFKEKVKFGNNSRLILKKNGFDEKNVISKYLFQLKNENQ